ncbi:MAG: 50S ribosomal protein L17 [Waddliaceae bacterium]
MRHRRKTAKLGRTTSHRRCLFANMLKSLIDEERIVTTVEKAKELRRFADQMITLAKNNSLDSRRRAIAAMMIRFNPLTSKEARRAKEGDLSSYNTDRKVVEKLFNDLGPRFTNREGGYTRIIKSGRRVGDAAQTCVIEYLAE